MTRRSAWLIIAVLVVSSSAVLRAQQRDTRPLPPPTAPTGPTGIGSLAGTVIADA